MGALIWQSEHKNEAHGCAINPDGQPGPSVFDIQKVGEVVTVYDYVNSQPFDTSHLHTVAMAQTFCELRYKEWLERMGLISIAVQDEELVLAEIRGFWRTPLQISDALKIDMPQRRLERALEALIAQGRVERNPEPTGSGAPTYRFVIP